jgi:small-conductance mechanosensitive channel/CRP-like cAMP-binding protein
VDLWLELTLYVAGWLVLTLVLTAVARRLDARGHPLRGSVRMLRGGVLPLALAWLLATRGLQWSVERDNAAVPLRVLETLLWFAAIVVAVSIVTHAALSRREGGPATRYPKLLLDILRLILVLIGTCFVVAGVWNKDLGGLLTAVGVSSIVLGLALQNTLDNVMAGIAVLFERPFEVGDWITIGALTGEVMEMNWRSVRIRTRDRDLFVVPNSVVGKETLVNLSRPTRAHAESHVLAFAYDDPPNKVKRVMLEVARATRGVLTTPPPEVLTKRYADWSIEYHVRYFLDDYERQLEINDEFMTRVWYAAKRHGLTIPFPTQVEYGMTPPAPPSRRGDGGQLANVPVFVPLAPEEMQTLASECERLEFGRGERIVRQGDAGDSMYVVVDGTAIVTVTDDSDSDREVARLGRGEFFGEMALLTGESRNANVTAVDDLTVLVITKAALQDMLAKRPLLAQEMAEIVAARRHGLQAVRDLEVAPPERRLEVQRATSALLQRVRRFFGL